jgi:hypothetical protein
LKDYYELGVILTRKKLYTQATKNLEKAKKVWDGEEADLAQVHNALGFCYFNMEKVGASDIPTAGQQLRAPIGLEGPNVGLVLIDCGPQGCSWGVKRSSAWSLQPHVP